MQELTDAQAASVYAGGRVALDDLFDEFARDHEGDAALGRIGTLHRVHVAEARRAPEVSAPARAFDRVVGQSVDAAFVCCPAHG